MYSLQLMRGELICVLERTSFRGTDWGELPRPQLCGGYIPVRLLINELPLVHHVYLAFR